MSGESKVILLSHGDGGAMTRQLIEEIFLPRFKNSYVETLSDAACLPVKEGRLCFTTDAFVVDPIFFPGGDIGKLAVCGTVNDLAVSGARPEYIAASFVLEEGLPMDVLEKIVASMEKWSRESGVMVVAGDTKVVPRGHADRIFITTAGIGHVPGGIELGSHRVRPGDVVMVNGSLGDHGLAVLAARENLGIEGIISDCAPLNGIVGDLLEFCGENLRIMRDLTRGGLATCLKEIAVEARVDVIIHQDSLPVSSGVAVAAEILGLDPLYLANEGKFLAIMGSRGAADGLSRLRSHPLGREAAVIGEVVKGRGNLYLKTSLGGTRELSFLAGLPLPRIC